MRSMIHVDPRNPKAVALGRFLQDHLDPASLPPDLCIVLGGDGMMLRAVHELGESHVLLGLNCGTLGFLLNDVPDKDRLVRLLLDRRWDVYPFPRIRMDAELGPEPEGECGETGIRALSGLAFNDVYVERAQALSCHLRVAINDTVVVDRLVCDGVVIATSIGSTGYSFSAGGPACHPLIRCLHITPICPRSPRLMPIVVPMTSRVEVWPLEPERRPVRVVLDWRGYANPRHLTVQDAHSDVRLAFLHGHDFTETMFRKVILS